VIDDTPPDDFFPPTPDDDADYSGTRDDFDLNLPPEPEPAEPRPAPKPSGYVYRPRPEPPPEPEPAPPPPAKDRATTRVDDLSIVHVNRLEAWQVIEEAWKAVFAANNPPWIFRRGDKVLTIGENEDGGKCLRETGTVGMQGILLRVSRWVRATPTGMTPCEPPKHAAPDMVETPSDKLPRIEGVIQTPTFARPARRIFLLNRPGYDAESRLYLAPGPDFIPPHVPTDPTARQVKDALDFIADEWLGDFPFETPADKAHTLALFFLTFMRRTIAGPTPLHLAEAATQGTGKSLLVRVVLTPSQGRFPRTTTYSLKHEEVAKKITSLLREGANVIYYDNVEGDMDSPDLAAVLTDTVWSDRILGGSVMGTFPNAAVWAASGNNCRMSTDIVRRTIKITLNRNMERPWEWNGARHPKLEEWTLENRRQLLGAGLTCVQSWVAAGAKPSKHSLGSFDAWAGNMGGLLEHLGIPGFLSNLREMHEFSDPRKLEWRAFVTHWWNIHGDTKRTAGDLATMADDHDLLSAVLGNANTDRSRTNRISKLLVTDQRNKVYGALKITVGQEHNQNVFSLVPIADPPPRERVAAPAPKVWGQDKRERDRYS
jgi:putative DNA primase/helicase